MARKRNANAKTELQHLVDLFNYFQHVNEAVDNIALYRGHGSDEYALTPSLFRIKSQRKDEKNILRELISLHPSEFLQDRNVFEQLVRMQHYSLPTRLLDLTFNPLVALYFACKDKPGYDGELIVLSVRKAAVRYFDSDTVSCIAGLSNMTGSERDELRRIYDERELNESHAGKRLLQFIRAEKPYFLPEMRPGDLKSIQVVRPKLSNRRIIAQQGAFLLFGLTSELQQTNSHGISVSRLWIPKSAKSRVLRELDRINVNESALFPEIDHAANYLMSKIAPLEEEVDLS